ncbi:MAG TPA: hypothetical protein VFK32_01410, partial [Tepidiformaceae bacterium]|nr:hypothetical protein [Tepidiformaceae bacterium]
MEQDRGPRPDGSRSSDAPLGDVDDDTWYFETSDERWALQEAKNKALKDAIRRNMSNNEEPSPKKDPFGATVKPESRRETDANDSPARPTADGSPSRESWSTEPWALAPRDSTPEPEARAADDGAPRSRWDEMFSAKAGDDNIEAMRKWMEGSSGAAGGDSENLDDEVEAKLRALEARDTGGHEDAAAMSGRAGIADDDALDPEIEQKLRALEAGGIEPAGGLWEGSAPLDLEIERKLRALEAGGDDEAAMGEPATWEQPRFSESAPLDLEIERKLRALESGTGGGAAGAGEPADRGEGVDAPSDQRWASVEEDDPYAVEFERMLAANAFAEAEATPAEEAAAEQRAYDDAAAREYWSDSFRSEEPVAEPEVAPADDTGRSPGATGTGDADGWAPEPITFDDWSRAGVDGAALANTGTADIDTSPGALWEPDDPGIAQSTALEAEADGWDPDATGSDVEEPVPSGPLAAAAAWIADPSSDPMQEPSEDDPWAMMHSVASVPADANPNWPFPEAVREPKSESKPAYEAPGDDPWAVSPIDELEASLEADASRGATTRSASTWPAQEDPQAAGTAWPAQTDRGAEADERQGADLYGDAGVLDTLDDILNDGQPADPVDTILAPAKHAWGAADRSDTPEVALPADPPRQ